MLGKPVGSFRIEVKGRFDALKDKKPKTKQNKKNKPTIEKMNTILKESMNTVQNETQTSIIFKKSTAETGIKSLDKKQKEL